MLKLSCEVVIEWKPEDFGAAIATAEDRIQTESGIDPTPYYFLLVLANRIIK